MNTLTKKTILGLLTVLCITLLAFVNADTKEDYSELKSYMIMVPTFEKSNVSTSDYAVNETQKNIKLVEANLLQQLKEAQSMQAKTYIIYMIGNLRSRSAIVELIKIVDFKTNFMDRRQKIARWDSYPAAEALGKIGSPAMQPIVNALGKESDELRIRLLKGVLCDILGSKMAKYYIESAISEASDKEKERLKKILILF